MYIFCIVLFKYSILKIVNRKRKFPSVELTCVAKRTFDVLKLFVGVA
jgi:hypothetical protein